MKKFKSSMKIVLLVFITVLLVLSNLMLFSEKSYAKTANELSEEDKKTLRYHQEPSLDMNFKDNEVCVILKSAFNDLEEISFDYFKIVEKVSRISLIDTYLEKYKYYKDGKFPLDKCKSNHMFKLVFENNGKENVIAICDLLETLDMVLCAEPNYIYDTIDNWVPNDKDYYDQWGLNGANGINIEQAWDITRGNLNVKVGIMENNIDITHYELKDRAFYGNFTPSPTADARHGTPIAGIIGAIQNNEAGEEGLAGIAGIAECSMYLLSRDDFVGSIRYAEKNGIKVINASFEFIIGNNSGPENYQPFNSNQYEALKNYSGLFVASAGNDGNNNDNRHHYPSDYDLPNVISVGALSKSGTNMALSNYGTTSVDLFAPGSDIYSIMPNNTFGYMHYTSSAAPHVTGVAALIYAKCPDITASEVKSFILKSVDKVDALKDLCVSGGKLNAYKAVSSAHTTNHTEVYHFRNKNEHEVYCDLCSKTLRIEQHNFIPYTSKTKVAVLPESFICTGCYCILHRNGDMEITYGIEDKYM